MKNAIVLARKDFESYFHTWVGVLALFLFLLIAGIFFSIFVTSYAKISLEAVNQNTQNVQGLGLTRFIFGSLFLNMGVVLMFFVPLLAMRSFAEERRLHTLELIFTYPFSDVEIVLGKYLSMWFFLGALTLPTLLYSLLVQGAGGAIDFGPVTVAYLGFALLAGAYLAMGLFVSSVSENPVVSAVVTFGCLLIFWVLDWVAGLADGVTSHLLSHLSPLRHYQDFTVGILDLSNCVYFLFFILYFLFLSLRSIEARHWKG